MENPMQKPITDLERIQQSYSSGSQHYVVAEDKPTPVRQSIVPQESTRDSQCQPPSKG
jgi:hypothetical protein